MSIIADVAAALEAVDLADRAHDVVRALGAKSLYVISGDKLIDEKWLRERADLVGRLDDTPARRPVAPR